MRKFIFSIAIIFVITTMLSISVVGEMPIRILIDGERLFFPDAQPFIDENGRTQTPSRFIGEELGATVTWDGNAQKATFKKGSTELVLYIGKKDYEINGQKKQMDTAALLKDGRTFVPARYVAEAFGASVRWDGVIRTVYIDTTGKATPAPTPAAQGTVTYYDGIAFNNVADVDQYGRMTIDKAQEFALKLANQLEFVKENGKYYIKCDYPEIPKEFQWTMTIRLNYFDMPNDWFTPTTRVQGSQIPREGSFKKEVVSFKDSKSIRSYIISISIQRINLIDTPENYSDYDTGHLSLRYIVDEKIKDIGFVPRDSSNPYTSYTEDFNFNNIFKW